MARGDEIDIELDAGRINCAVCGEGHIDIENGGSGTCPNCRESYSFSIHEEFALMETDGWVVQVTVDDPAAESADVVNV